MPKLLPNYKKLAVDLVFDFVSAILFSVGLGCFSAPNQIAPGGVSGIAVLIRHLTGFQLGTLMMCMNIPLLLLAWRFLGRAFTLNTLKTVAIQTMILNVTAPYLPPYRGEPILAGLFGGVLIGGALALVFMRGSTTGGGDIVSRLVQLRFRHVPIGKMMFFFDMMVLLASVLVFHNIEAGLYGMISIFTTSKVVDGILYGMYTGKVLLVISPHQQEIAKEILEKLNRGVTFLDGVGAYSGKQKQVLMCAVRSTEYYNVEEIIKQLDPDAFVLTLEANEIQGEGFHLISQQKVT
ncbi:MAG: YitT family protein [Angelakisella sp.]